MVSFQNGVIYGTGNVLGYDKVGQEYVIKRQLEKDGDLIAMGKSPWHYATIGHILKKRLYCGELEYWKEYVPDYLEQKRAKNNGEMERVIVEGKHQPIVIKEEFERVQNLLAERNAESRNYRKNKGVYSDDLWRGGSCAASAAMPLQRPSDIPRRRISPSTPINAMTRPGGGTLKGAAAVLGCGIAGVEQAEVLQDKSIVEERLKKEQGRYETLLDMRRNNEIPKEVFSRKQQEVEEGIAELEQQMMQYGDVKPATDEDVSGKLEGLRRLMEQFAIPGSIAQDCAMRVLLADVAVNQQLGFFRLLHFSSLSEYSSDLRMIA